MEPVKAKGNKNVYHQEANISVMITGKKAVKK
jgi:hypothetical protein